MSFICFNGKLVSAATPVINSDNRSFKFGDGVFETMKMIRGQTILKPYHFERLFAGLKLLKIDTGPLSVALLTQKIIELAGANNLENSVRIRLALYRNSDNHAEYIIETSSLGNDVNEWNEKGWTIDIYADARKSCDAFSNIKSANHLTYVMADIYRREKGLDEAVVLNEKNNICDGSRSNLFLILGNEIYTPPLEQGCINGVVRRYLVEQLRFSNFIVKEIPLGEELLAAADEAFVTNAVISLRWVKKFREKTYNHLVTQRIYHDFIAPLFI